MSQKLTIKPKPLRGWAVPLCFPSASVRIWWKSWVHSPAAQAAPATN